MVYGLYKYQELWTRFQDVNLGNSSRTATSCSEDLCQVLICHSVGRHHARVIYIA